MNELVVPMSSGLLSLIQNWALTNYVDNPARSRIDDYPMAVHDSVTIGFMTRYGVELHVLGQGFTDQCAAAEMRGQGGILP
jgi:hypothetical protein